MARQKLDKKKISFNIPNALLEEIEEYCKANTLPLTQGIHILVRYGLDYYAMMKNVPELLKMANAMKSSADEIEEKDETETD